MTVKQDSIDTFFNKYTNIQINSNVNCDGRRVNYRSLFQDEILIVNLNDLKDNDFIMFELEDISENSRRKLLTHYSYNLVKYDDICYKLILSNFSVVLND
jgi:hypothetical protein